MKEPRIVFMGTPDFAVGCLKALHEAGKNIAGVITVPDKPAGRGQQVQQSAVKQYALEKGLTILQPEKLKDPAFLEELRALNADLQIVVAFRMLPEVVWSMPPLGTFNLHASLLPQYRGAAPINRAVMNGEKVTGVTTFFLDKEIDTGKVIFREEVQIGEDETAGELHDRLMDIGARLVVRTVDAIRDEQVKPVAQEELISGELKHAPKIFREDCRIDWRKDVQHNYNFIRGLSPYPAAYTELQGPAGEKIQLKIYKASVYNNERLQSGSIRVKDKKELYIACSDGELKIDDLQLAGKKRMRTEDFLRGFIINENWKAE